MTKRLRLMMAVVVLAACGPTTREGRIEALTGSVSSGEALYASTCASCHGADGKGLAGSGPALDEPAKNDSAQELIGVIVNGRPNTAMGAYGYRTDQQLADLYAYIKATFGK